MFFLPTTFLCCVWGILCWVCMLFVAFSGFSFLRWSLCFFLAFPCCPLLLCGCSVAPAFSCVYCFFFVCVSTPVPKGSDVSKQGAQAHRGYLCQRSCSTMGDAEIDHLRVPAELFFKLSLHSSSLCFMVVLTIDPKTFPSAAFSCRALTACECLST